MLINNFGAAYFNATPGELTGRPFEEFLPDYYVEHLRRIREVIDSRESREFEYEIVFPSGTSWLLTNVQPVKDAQDHVSAAQFISQDITERRQAENARERSQKLLLALSKAAPLVQLAQNSWKIYQTMGDEIKKLGFHAAVVEIAEDQKSLKL